LSGNKSNRPKTDTTSMKRLIASIAFLAVALGAAAHHTDGAHKALVNKDRSGVAIQGYDPVAYFTEGKPLRGSSKITATHDGAIYQFASAAHRDMFEADPDKYVPAYGGYCGYAASINRLSPISPEVFQIIEGRLVLQHNQRALDKWNVDIPGNVVLADRNWPGLVERNGTVGTDLLFLDKKGVALEGYDPVSYFADGAPAKGDPAIEATYNGALYHFVSQEHRATFESDPAKYVPAYGGYCGYAASIGKVRPADPLLWSIVDGRLIVQHTKGAAELWEKDVAGNKMKADAFWPRLVVAKAGKKNPVDSLFGKSVLPDANAE